MSNENNFEDPFQDPFDDQMQHDPFIDDHFSGQPQGGQEKNHGQPDSLPDATAVLVLGILSILGAFCYGIVGLILGILAVALAGKPMRLYRSDPSRYSVSSYNNLNAGKICGIIGLSISALIILVVIGAVIFALTETGYRY